MSSLVKITVNQTTDLVSVKVFQAENGAQGDRAGLKYTFSTSTGPGAPSPGYLKFNSATLSAVTQIAIRDTDFNGADTTALLALIDDSTSTMKARVLIRSNSNSDTSNFNFLVTSVTDEGNHFHINGTYVSGSAFADDEVVTFDFYMTGDLGATGPAPSGTGFVKVTGGVLDPASQNLGAAIINANIVPDADSSRSIGSDSIYLDYLYANTILANGITLGYMPTGTVPGSITIYSDTNTNSTSISSASTGSRSISFPDASGTLALTTNKLSAFAATTSAELAGVISDETGSGSLVFGTSPTIDAPTISGAASFTGTTRPTSAGTGTPAATSLMTRNDLDARVGRSVTLASDLTITSNAVAQDVPGMSHTVEANKSYSFIIIMEVSENASPRNQSYEFGMPSGGAVMLQLQATASGSPAIYNYGNSGSVPNALASGAFGGVVTISGMFTNSSTAGNLVFKARQTVSSATAMTIKKGAVFAIYPTF